MGKAGKGIYIRIPYLPAQRCHLSLHNALGVRQPGKLQSQSTLIFLQQMQEAALTKNYGGKSHLTPLQPALTGPGPGRAS